MRKILAAALMIAITAPVVAVEPAAASSTYSKKNANGRYVRCKRTGGTTGAIVGGVGGAVVADALGAGTVGTIAGAGGGALLGRHVEKKKVASKNRRRGC